MLQDIKAFKKTFQSTSAVIRTLMDAEIFANENDAFVVLRACLKTLRDRLETGEAIHLGGQLPALLRGFYYESWDYGHQTMIRTKEGFLQEVKKNMKGHDEILLEIAVPVVMKTILDMIDQGEAVQVLHGVSKEIRELLP